MTIDPAELPPHYYDFGGYVDRQRWLTYYHQLHVLMRTPPGRLLEVGVGPGVVRAVLESRGWTVATVDVNDSLRPDFVADLRDLPMEITQQQWDWLLCSRVLHHIPLADLETTLEAMTKLDASHYLVTVPREDLSIQLHIRRTAGRNHAVRISGGSRMKRLLRGKVIRSAPSGVWMLDGNGGLTRSDFRGLLERHFAVENDFVLHDDPSHVFYVLRSLRR